MRAKIAIVDFPLPQLLCNCNLNIISTRRAKLTLFNRLSLKIPILNNLFRYKILYNDNWEKACKNYDTIILFDSIADYHILCDRIESIVKPNVKLILYQWNPVQYSNNYKKISSRWNICSFSKKDSIKYNFKYIGPFYNQKLVIGSSTISNDTLFVGLDKGRKPQLDTVKSIFESYHLKANIKIIDNKKAIYNRQYHKWIPYEELCNYITQTKSLLEIVQDNQTGPTLRCMEALFFNKKIITNNTSIVDYDFYSKDRFFIIGVDRWENIVYFLNQEIKPLPNKITAKYDIIHWINRISHV